MGTRDIQKPNQQHPNLSTPEAIAKEFHDAYEKLAPKFGYKTREASAVEWANVPQENKSLMIAVIDFLILEGVIQSGHKMRPTINIEEI